MIGTIYAILLILALLAFEAGEDGSINCNSKIFSYHWFVLDSVDLIQSALICASAVFIVRHLKQTMQKKDPGAGGFVDDLMLINNQTMSIISEAPTATALHRRQTGKETFIKTIATVGGKNDSQLDCILEQTKVLAVSYMVFATSDIIMMTLGNFLFELSIDFECDFDTEIIRK